MERKQSFREIYFCSRREDLQAGVGTQDDEFTRSACRRGGVAKIFWKKIICDQVLSRAPKQNLMVLERPNYDRNSNEKVKCHP